MADFELDFAEEQADELEALESIYDDAYTKLEERPVRLRLRLEPDPGAGDDENHVCVDLEVCFPPTYPEVAPELKVEPTRGLSLDQAEEIRGVMEGQVEENLGGPMVYTLAEAAREWLVEHNVPGLTGSAYAAMMSREHEKQLEQKRKEAAEERRQIGLADAAAALGDKDEDPGGDEAWRAKRLAMGTPVTKESFHTWRRVFDEETGDGELEVEDPRPSGKQIFLMALQEGQDLILLENDDEEQEEDGKDGEESQAVVEIDEELFGDDDDLDDLEDDDDDDDDDDDGGEEEEEE